MEVDCSANQVVAKRLWNMLKVAIFMVRKGIVLKRKLVMDMHMMMKRGKVLGKSLGSLMFHHSHGNSHHYSTGLGIREYEFSCNNSPAFPSLSFHWGKKKHNFFPSIPCIQPHADGEDEYCENTIVVSQCEYFTRNNMDLKDLPGLDQSTRPQSPFCCVDREAEEFISKFYQQIQLQRQVSFVQYNEMLARGSG